MNIFSEIKEGARISGEAIRGNMLRSVLTTTGNLENARSGAVALLVGDVPGSENG